MAIPEVARTMDDVRITKVGDGREIPYRVMSNTDGPVLLHRSRRLDTDSATRDLDLEGLREPVW